MSISLLLVYSFDNNIQVCSRILLFRASHTHCSKPNENTNATFSEYPPNDNFTDLKSS